MNEELQKALTDILNSGMDAAAQAKDFVLSELPDVVKQLLAWKLAENLFYSAIGVIVIVTIVLVMAKIIRIRPKSWEETSNFAWICYKGLREIDISAPGLMFFVFGGIGLLFSTIATLSSLSEALQIWLAPKVYLIEYTANLAK